MPNATDDLDWIAFLYVTDELDPAARAAFEIRLDQDQAAREAVAAAVGLVEAVQQVSVSAPRVTRPTRRYRWAGLAAAAVIGGALVLLPSRKVEPPDSVSVPTQNEPITADVALAWSDLHGQRVADAAETWAATEPIETIDPAVASVQPPPSWLLLAAAPDAEVDPLEAEPRQED